ncbi:MAG: phosphonate C-P lyase system protein PhnH [Dehalococcoidia bacterium]
MSVPVLSARSAREQRVFRALLNAMARPGTVGVVGPHPSGGRPAAAVAMLEAVLDHEVTFAVAPEQSGVIDTLLRLTGSFRAAPEEADYLLCEGDGIAAALRDAREGTPEFPDRSGTVFALVEHVAEEPGRGEPLTLAGPGIEETRTVWVDGLSKECGELFIARNGDLPMGIDLVLVAPDGRFTCLTRYARLKGEE